MAANKTPKYLQKARKASEKAGWTWQERTNHITIRDASNEFVVCVSTTAYDGSLTKKVLSTLKKAGCPGLA